LAFPFPANVIRGWGQTSGRSTARQLNTIL
jgi:hypothetical protein